MKKYILMFSLLISTYAPHDLLASAFVDPETQTQRPFHSQEALDTQYQTLRFFMPETTRENADSFYSTIRSLALDIRNTRLSTTLSFQEKLKSFSASTKEVTHISTAFINSENPSLPLELKRAINGCAGYYATQENALFLEYLWSELDLFLKEISSFKNTTLPPLEKESFEKAHDLLARYEAIHDFHKSITVEPAYSFLQIAQQISDVKSTDPLMLCDIISNQFAKVAEDILYKFSYNTNLESYAIRLGTLDEAQRLDFYNLYKKLYTHAQKIDPYEGNTLNNLSELLEFFMVYTKLSPEERAHFQFAGTAAQQHTTLPQSRAHAVKSRARAPKRHTAHNTIASMRTEIATHLLEKARRSLDLATDRYASLLDRDAFATINNLFTRCLEAYDVIHPTHEVAASSSQIQEPITQPLVVLQNLLSDIQNEQNTLREAFHEKSVKLAATRSQDNTPQEFSAASSAPVHTNMRSAVIDEHIKAGKLTSAEKHKPKKGPKKNNGRHKGKRR